MSEKNILDERLGPIGPTHAAKHLREAIARLGTAGATPPPNSRLHKALAGLLPFTEDGAPQLTPQRRRLLGEAMRTASEWDFISRALPRRTPLPKRLHRELQLAYEGSIDPWAQDGKSTKARDLQFQIYQFAWFLASGMPAKYEEPDIQIAYRFEWHGVAAKRVQSPNRVLANVAAGAKQVRKHAKTGFVALCIDTSSKGFRALLRQVIKPESLLAHLPHIKQATRYLQASCPWINGLYVVVPFPRWSLAGKARPVVNMTDARWTIGIFDTTQDMKDFEERTLEMQSLLIARLSGKRRGT